MAGVEERGKSVECFHLEDVPTPPTTDSAARLGSLAIKGSHVIETPNFLAISSRGAVPHLTPDVLAEKLQVGGVHVAIEDFLEKAAMRVQPPITKCPSASRSRFHSFTAMPEPILTLLAPRRTPPVSAPVGNSKEALQIFPSTGFQPLKAPEYAKYAQTLGVDLAVAPADIAHGTTPSRKRLDKMGDRTTKWLSAFIATISTPSDSEHASPNPLVLAPILPIAPHYQTEYFDYLVSPAVAHKLSGLAYYPSSSIPTTPPQLSKLLRLSLAEPSSPHQLLQEIANGMDLFTIPFVTAASDAGIALTFQFPAPSPPSPPTTSENDTQNGSGTTLLPLGIDLALPTHRTALTPLVSCCTCYTCTSHHRAYICHLLSVKEMLGWTLLQIHNHFVLSDFFANIRKSIAKGCFEKEKERFDGVYEREVGEGTAKGPRLRGYMYRSEGPGKRRRNGAAWGKIGGGEVEEEEKAKQEMKEEEKEEVLVPTENAGELEEKGFAEKVDEK